MLFQHDSLEPQREFEKVSLCACTPVHAREHFFFFLSTFECFFLGFSHQAYAAPLIRHSRRLDFPPTDELETRMEEQVDRGHISIEGAIIEGFFFAWY